MFNSVICICMYVHMHMAQAISASDDPVSLHSVLFVWLTMVFVWVASYTHGQRRIKVDARREFLLLPRSGAWVHKLKEVDPDYNPQPVMGRHTGSTGIEVIGLAEINPGTVWDRDAQWQYFRQPRDAFFAAVERIFAMEEFTAMYFQKRARRSRLSAVDVFAKDIIKVTLGSAGLVINADNLGDSFVVSSNGAASLARDVLQHDGSGLLTVLLADPLCRLLRHGRLPHIMLLSRWHGALDLWPDWPDRRWAEVSRGKDYKLAESEELTLQDVQAMIADMKRWSPRIIGEHNDEEGPSEEQQLLERHVAKLQG